MNSRLAKAIVAEAERIGADPLDLATVMSYETGGTFDPWQKGPTTKWGTHRGLIQMGEPQRKQFGYYRGMPIEDAVRASGSYLVKNGFKPGMNRLQMYSIINAGGPNRFNRSDEAAGGAPGTVKDKVYGQMRGHEAKAQSLLAGSYTPTPRNYYDTDRDVAGPEIGLHQDAAITAPTPTNYVEVADARDQGPEAYDGFWDEFGAHMQSSSISAHLIRTLSEGQDDPDFVMGSDRWLGLAKEYPETYHDFLRGSTSEEVLQTRMKWASEDMTRQGRLGQGGWRSTAAGFLSGVVDPAVSIPSIATGGLGTGLVAGMGLAGRMAVGAAAGSATNAAIELGSKYALDNPHADPLMGAAAGALFGSLGGALTRAGKGASFEAGLAHEQVLKMAQDERSVPMHRDGSVGAARNPEATDSLIGDAFGYATEIRDESVPRGFGGVLRQDATGQLTTSEDPLTRLFGLNLFEETAGTKDHSVVPDSVNSRHTAHHRKMLGNFEIEYGSAKRAFIAEGDLSVMNRAARARREKEYQEAVWDYVWDPHPAPDTNQNVVKGGEVLRKMYHSYMDDMNRVGLSDAKADKHYMPLVADHDVVAQIDQAFNHRDIEKLIKESIKRHWTTVDDGVAERMAKGYWQNLRKAGYGIEDGVDRSLHLNDREGFKSAVREGLDDKNLLSDKELDDFMDMLSGLVDDAKGGGEGSKGVGYLKRRTLLDYNAAFDVPDRTGKIHKLRVRDLFNRDAEMVFRRYARSMSGRIAFADTKLWNPSNGELIMDGIKSEGDLKKLLSAIAESHRKLNMSPEKRRASFENAKANIEFGWKKINGMPVYGQETSYAQWVRRVKDYQFSRLMPNMGLNQIQETWKIFSLTGFRAAMSQMPAIRDMTRAAAEGKFKKDKLLAELADITGIGLEHLWTRADLRIADDRLGASPGGNFTRRLDNFLDAAQDLTSHVSFQRQIQAFQQRWALKAITQQMANMARKVRAADGSFDYEGLKLRDRQRLASIGLGEDDAKLLFKNLLDHSEFEGKKIVGVNVTRWDPEAVSKYRLFLGRYTDRLVQQNDFGAMHRWASAPVAQLFVQFRSFVFGAWAKSTLWSINHGAFTDPRMMVLILGELAAGVATYAVRQSGNAVTSDGWEKYWEEQMQPANLLKNGWARTASASVLPMFADTLLQWTPIGPQFGNARSSGSSTDALFGSPAVDNLESLRRFTIGAQKAAFGGGELTQQQVRSGARLLPLGNWVPLTAALGALIQDMPER